MAKLYKVHPAIGIARLGDGNAECFFVGPEIPGRSSELDQSSFRDGLGRIRPQGACFRVFAHDTSAPGAEPQEVNVGGDVVAIDWTVHLANKKAYWYEFHGRVGETSPDVPPAQVQPYPANSLRNLRGGEPDADRRKRLIIDPRPRSLRADGTAQSVAIDTGTSSDPAAETWPVPAAGGGTINYLGRLFADANGRLTIVGGRGVSVTTVPGSKLPSYANNDNWFDDVSDGPVTAMIRFKNAPSQVVVGGWVIVAPPRFAPSVKCVVTMHDAIYDVAVRHHNWNPALYDAAAHAFRSNYEPSFTDEIYPILRAAEMVGWLFFQTPDFLTVKGEHGWDYASLGTSPFPGGAVSPGKIFNKLRRPDEWADTGSGGKMPILHGDAGEGRSFLTLTQTQYFIMSQWQAGKFKPGGVAATPPSSTAVTASGLDRSALENCVGGAFYPGIEAGWILRDPRIVEPLDPFRIQVLPDGQEANPDGLTPGGATMRSALPWQADFNDCADMWWPSHRPTDVLKTVADAAPARWAKGIEDAPDSHRAMVDHWNQLHFVRSAAADGNPPLVQAE